jgi:hypothetical protein
VCVPTLCDPLHHDSPFPEKFHSEPLLNPLSA